MPKGILKTPKSSLESSEIRIVGMACSVPPNKQPAPMDTTNLYKKSLPKSLRERMPCILAGMACLGRSRSPMKHAMEKKR